MKILTLDIGGTRLKSGIIEERQTDRTLRDIREKPSNASEGANALLEVVRQEIKARLQEENSGQHIGISAIAISTAGQVDSTAGTIVYANNNIPGYTGTPLRSMLSQEFGLPVHVANDAAAAALGELHYGAGRGLKNFVCLTYGTGIGGALVIDGKLYEGSTFSAGEIGAMIIHPEDRDPASDMYAGGYEKYASTTALLRLVQKRWKENQQGEDIPLSGREIFSRLNEPVILQAVDEWITEVLYGLISIIHVLNPEAIILGGGVMEQSYIIEQLQTRLPKELMPSFAQVRLIPAELGNQAALYGAAAGIQRQ